MILQKFGNEYQLAIEKPEDLEQIAKLDEAHWTATGTSCRNLNCDPKLLHYLDTDANARIRAGELKAAQAWLFHRLADRSQLAQQTSALPLAALDTSHPEGVALQAAARRILANLGQPDATEITLSQVRNRQQIVSGGACNGDGVIPPEALEDADTAQLVTQIIETIGSVADINGRNGVTGALLDEFLAEAEAFLAWIAQGQLPAEGESTPIQVWGEATAQAYATLEAIRPKIDEFFSLCMLVRLNDQAAERIGITPAKLDTLEQTDPIALNAFIAAAPLAEPNGDERLALDDRINPLFRDEVQSLCDHLLHRANGGTPPKQLTRAEWEAIKAQFAPHAAWSQSQRGGRVEPLGQERLRAILAGPQIANLRRQIEHDQAVALELRQVEDVEKLILYQQWLLDFANNFVAFAHLFDPSKPSMVQCGSLVMDGRHFDLNIRVAERAEHRKIAERSNICVMYLEVRKRHVGETIKMQVASAVTSGDTSRLFIGKAGVFFTPDGAEWDALLVDLLARPVSISEAIRLPFRRMGEFLEKQAERITASRQSEMEGSLDKSITRADQATKSPPPKPDAPTETEKSGALRNLMLSGSLAFAAVGSAFAFIVNSLQDVTLVKVVMVLASLLGLLILPPIIVSVVKLRRRNLSIFLEASGWSINAQLRLSRRMGKLFTYIPAPPKNAVRRKLDMLRRFVTDLAQKQDNP